MAVALLARRQENLSSVASNLQNTSPGSIVETFATDTSPNSFKSAFQSIRAHNSFKGLKLKVAVYSVKHSN
jgi:short-subunit dehydrogenase